MHFRARGGVGGQPAYAVPRCKSAGARAGAALRARAARSGTRPTADAAGARVSTFKGTVPIAYYSPSDGRAQYFIEGPFGVSCPVLNSLSLGLGVAQRGWGEEELSNDGGNIAGICRRVNSRPINCYEFADVFLADLDMRVATPERIRLAFGIDVLGALIKALEREPEPISRAIVEELHIILSCIVAFL